jgi:probable phosphoglycerate mutase
MLAALALDLCEATFVASPLSRACESLKIIMGELVTLGTIRPAKPYTTDIRLKELSFGRWEGLTWKEVRRDHRADYMARDADIWNVAPPDGESYAELTLRAGPALAALPSGSIVVSHGGISRIALHAFAGMRQAPAAKAPIYQGDVLLLENGRASWASGAVLDTVVA